MSSWFLIFSVVFPKLLLFMSIKIIYQTHSLQWFLVWFSTWCKASSNSFVQIQWTFWYQKVPDIPFSISDHASMLDSDFWCVLHVFLSLKLVCTIFYQIFIFSPNYYPLKNYEKCFISSKKLFLFSRYFFLSFPHLPDIKGQMEVE